MALGNSGIDKWNDLDGLLGDDHQDEYPYEGGVFEKSGDAGSGEQEPDPKPARKTEEMDPNPAMNNEKLIHHRAAKYSDRQIRLLQDIKDAMGTKSDSDALRWVFDKVCEEHGDEIEKIAKKRRRIGTL